MIRQALGSTFVLFAVLFSSLAMAINTTDPITMLKDISTNVLRALKENKAQTTANSKKIYEVVDKYILPYVDFNEMSVWVAGRTAWGKAPEKSRDEFVSAFKILVVRTYATALDNYSNEIVDFAPQKVDTSKKRIQISSKIKRASKENINVDYRLIKHGDSWLVYDIIIEGVSILQGFQAQFSDKIRQQGLDTVIAQIKEHNKKDEA